MMNLDSNAHSVFLLHYHLVLVVKYRRQIFNDEISNRAREIFEYIAPNYNITTEEWNLNSVLNADLSKSLTDSASSTSLSSAVVFSISANISSFV